MKVNAVKPLWGHRKHWLPWSPMVLLFVLWTASLWRLPGDSDAVRIHYGQGLLLSACAWALCLALGRKLWIALLLAAPGALLWPVEVWLRQAHGTSISSHTVAMAMESNWGESSNFFSAHGLPLMLACLGWWMVFSLGGYAAYRSGVAWNHRSRYWMLAAALAVLSLSSLSAVADNGSTSFPQPSDILLAPGIPHWGTEWDGVFPLNVAVAFTQHQQLRQLINSLRTKLQQRPMPVKHIAAHAPPDIVVLVIGESASAARWQLLGYERETTPLLAELPGVAVFSDVVAISNATRTAVPGVLSRHPVLAPDGSINTQGEASIVRAFRESGYQTHWLSNQAPFGPNDTAISLYAFEAEDVRFLNPATYADRSSPDEVLLPALQSVLRKPGRHFIVLHLLGSHFDYGLRYPAAFDYFTPSSQNVRHPTSEQVNNSYDNSVRYTDHLLAQVIAQVQKHSNQSVVSYFSDHGVDPVKGTCASQSAGRRSEAAYRVPAFVWLGDGLRTQATSAWQQLQDNAHRSFTTRAIYSTLMELSGITLEGGLPGESFLQGTHQPNPSRLVAAHGGRYVDFDAARKKNACQIAGD